MTAVLKELEDKLFPPNPRIKLYYVAHQGEYVRIQASSEAIAIKKAKEDYERGAGRIRDWKDCEDINNKWDVFHIETI